VVQLSTLWVTPNRGMGPPWGAFCQITLTSCCNTCKALGHGSQFYLQLHQCLPLPRKRSPDGASPDWGCRHLIVATTHLSTPKGWKAESACWADLRWTVYPRKWSPVRCRSSIGQRKFARQRQTFYHCALSGQCELYASLIKKSKVVDLYSASSWNHL